MSGLLTAVCVVAGEQPLPGRNGDSKPGRRTAIDKRPVSGAVLAQPLGLAGDYVCDTKNHGGPHQAVYAYAAEEAQRWADELGREVPPGWFGENLRTSGIAVSDAIIGERWQIGGALLEVSQPRVPCATFQHWTGEPHWVKRFTARADTGAYLRVLTPGPVTAGDRITVAYAPEHRVTIRQVFTGSDPGALRQLLELEPTVSPDVRRRCDRHLNTGPSRAR